jgi:hypothetical protein
VPLLTNGLRKCGIYIQWNFTELQRRMKLCHLQLNEWNWRTSPYVKSARLRRPKAACSLLYADCRPKTIAGILWDTGDTKGRLCKGGIGQGRHRAREGNQKLE